MLLYTLLSMDNQVLAKVNPSIMCIVYNTTNHVGKGGTAEVPASAYLDGKGHAELQSPSTPLTASLRVAPAVANHQHSSEHPLAEEHGALNARQELAIPILSPQSDGSQIFPTAVSSHRALTSSAGMCYCLHSEQYSRLAFPRVHRYKRTSLPHAIFIHCCQVEHPTTVRCLLWVEIATLLLLSHSLIYMFYCTR